MLRIAVTGGIACGKSHLASYVKARGIATCEADTLAHAVLANDDKVYASVVRTFGTGVLHADGSIDRRKLGELVFSESRQRVVLNRLVHPVVKQDVAHWLNEQELRRQRMAVVIVPLLFEAGMEKGWDAIICVGGETDVQIRRLRKRGFNTAASRRRVAAQMPLAQKAKRSDYVIWNDGSLEQFEVKIETVLNRIEETIR